MSRNIVLTLVLLLSFTINFPSSAEAMPTNTLTILPKDCRIPVGEEMPLTLDGFIPPHTVVSWNVNEGGITSVLPGLNAIFVAPSKPAVVTISVSLSPAVPGMQTPITQQCTVTSLNSMPNRLAQVTGMDDLFVSWHERASRSFDEALY